MSNHCNTCLYYGDPINSYWCRRHGKEVDGGDTCDSYEERYEDLSKEK